MRFWPLHPDLAATLEALRSDDRPLRDAYERRAHWTVAMMRERLAEPGDHQRSVWPNFESYRDFVFATASHSRRRDCVELWRSGSSPVLRSFRFAAISDFVVVTSRLGRTITQVQFWPDNEIADQQAQPSYLMDLV